MGLISPGTYKSIADNIDLAQVKTVDISTSLTRVLNNLYNSEISNTDNDKLWLYNLIYQEQKIIEQRQSVYNPRLRTFVKALQDHVSNNYGDVNDYLSDNNIQVYQTFAEVSEFIGYPIDDDNIATATFVS